MAHQLTYAEIERIDRAVEESGLELIEADGHRPRTLRVRFPRTRTEAHVLVYVWAIRPGGGGPGVRPDDERRVQMTRPNDADFVTAPQAKTLLLGFDPTADLYAAWDFSLRRWTRNPPGHPSGTPVGSPSAQTRQSVIESADRKGIDFYAHDIESRKKNGTKASKEELVANFRPDHFDAYLGWLNPKLLPPGKSAPARAAKRRRVATERLARDARFAKTVVEAYGERCCLCGLGARIVDAAHIKPVSDGGPDHITNGIALCPTHHRLFDRGYMLVRPATLALQVNDKKMKADRVSQRDRERIADGLTDPPAWPASQRVRPDARFIRRHRRLHQS